jgi:hypothetical protein
MLLDEMGIPPVPKCGEMTLCGMDISAFVSKSTIKVFPGLIGRKAYGLASGV